MTTQSFDADDRNVVRSPGGQRVHRRQLEQLDHIRAGFHRVRDGVWSLVGNGLSNQMFVEGPEGIIAIDTGECVEEMREALRQLREVTDTPIAAVVYTHFHYVDGTRAVLDEGNHVDPLPVYGHERIAVNKVRTLGEIAPAYSRGLIEQFGIVMPDEGPDGIVSVGLGYWYKNPAHAPYTFGHIPVNRPLKGGERLTIAGLDVEVEHAPSDADDSCNFFFPALSLCINNSVWPVLFNVFPIRGEEYRDPRVLIPGIDRIREWDPEHLVTGHGVPVSGRGLIREITTRYRDSIQFMWDQTVRGINKGWTADEVAHRVVLPEAYDRDYFTRQGYGLTEHHVRQIFMGLRGWFDGDETKLFPLETTDRNNRLIDGFGGRDVVAGKCRAALADGDLRWATELAGWLVRSEGAGDDDRNLLASCLRTIAERTTAANIRDWAIVRARHHDGSTPLDRYYRHNFNPRLTVNLPVSDLVHQLRVVLDPTGLAGFDHHFAFEIDGTRCGLHVRNHVAVPTDGNGAATTVSMRRDTLTKLLAGIDTFSALVASGDMTVDGDARALDTFRVCLENKGMSS
ncbi:MAG: alkyl sulfatase dimerization domain-containing protein [Ilumatobacteraceae bacterium]